MPSEPYTYATDRFGGATLTRTADGATVYFQPGDDANIADAEFSDAINASAAAEYFPS